MKYRYVWVLVAALLSAGGVAQAEEKAATKPDDVPASVTSSDNECEDAGYKHDHRRQKGQPSAEPRCVSTDEAGNDAAEEKSGHDHRKQHKQQ